MIASAQSYSLIGAATPAVKPMLTAVVLCCSPMESFAGHNDHLTAYQSSQLTPAETTTLFQRLIDTDAVWQMTEQVHRKGVHLIEEGICFPGQISDGAKANFQTLLRAATDHQLCLMSCLDRIENRCVPVICAVNRGNDQRELVPLAILLGHTNPYERLVAPINEAQAVPPEREE